ncbi:hypothetical protein VTK73DRAFT_9829 [Phialemonium thermophilum]|uniref:MT-A70-domain-containing protein n=1 Tax=Phialemonium thermophilum TaxID=223376 RepID=A0ABR3W022_9PEZI
MSAVLYQDDSRTVVLLDLPRTLEEAQFSSAELATIGAALPRRIIAGPPPDAPFPTPEPRQGALSQTAATPSAQVSELMTAASVDDALTKIRREHRGPWCLPRVPAAVNPSTTPAAAAAAAGAKRKPPPSRGQGAPCSSPGPPPYIPRDARYLHGTIQSERARFLATAPVFDLVVLDPPWPNRSARRKKGGYSTASTLDEVRELLSLVPLPSRLSPDGLVAVWVTNAPGSASLLTSPGGGLLAEWGLELVDEWTWLKVTTQGVPIVPVDSAWRKPWERLLVARRRGSSRQVLGARKVIVAVPDVHSRKPNLRALFEETLGAGYRGLEIFARSLTAGWWSWGDEVLLFQQPDQWIVDGK